jgi:excisionase family DNA binding protein
MTTRITAAEREEARWTWLTVAECAERLGKSPTHVRNLIKSGALKAADLSAGTKQQRADYAVRPEWLAEFVESRIVSADAA